MRVHACNLEGEYRAVLLVQLRFVAIVYCVMSVAGLIIVSFVIPRTPHNG